MISFGMVQQEGEEASWMANHRVGETDLAYSGPSTRPVAYGIHGCNQAANKFFDQDGAIFFGGLEEALMMQGVDGIRENEDTKSFLQSKPATLEIFPSWPMRFQQTPRLEKTQSARSFDSGSTQNVASHLGSDSPASRRASSDQSADHKPETMMMAMMIPSGASTTATASNPLPASQEKRKMTGSTGGKDGKKLDAKTLRRLAQNREAARKSRLRKKAYVQQLESSRIRLQQLEHDIQRARSQGLFLGGGTNGAISSGAAMFNVEYARWLEENCKQMADLGGALQAHLPEGNLNIILDECISNFDELFRLKAIVAKTDVFHLLNGTWATPAERCFLWMGGFRPSELVKVLIPQLGQLTEQQLLGICSLQHSSQQAEEALSQGLDQLRQSLADAVAGGSLSDSFDVGNYMGQMIIAVGKLASLEGFVRQADNLRQQTLHHLRRTLTIRQAARCFLAIGEYYARLRALSSLWASRPRQNLIGNDAVESSTADLQIVHQPLQNHFSSY